MKKVARDGMAWAIRAAVDRLAERSPMVSEEEVYSEALFPNTPDSEDDDYDPDLIVPRVEERDAGELRRRVARLFEVAAARNEPIAGAATYGDW